MLARWPGTHSRILSGIQRAAQTVLGVYLKRTCSRVTSASSARGVLNDYALYKSTHSLTVRALSTLAAVLLLLATLMPAVARQSVAQRRESDVDQLDAPPLALVAPFHRLERRHGRRLTSATKPRRRRRFEAAFTAQNLAVVVVRRPVALCRSERRRAFGRRRHETVTSIGSHRSERRRYYASRRSTTSRREVDRLVNERRHSAIKRHRSFRAQERWRRGCSDCRREYHTRLCSQHRVHSDRGLDTTTA